MKKDEIKNEIQPLLLGAVSGCYDKANSISNKIIESLSNKCKRDEIVPLYCELINESAKLVDLLSEQCFKVNMAIKRKWSESAIEYIKVKAWKLYEKKVKTGEYKHPDSFR